MTFAFIHRRTLAKITNDITLLEIGVDEYIATASGISVEEKEAWVEVQKANIRLLQVKQKELDVLISRLQGGAENTPRRGVE
jgi:hypothetical protein